MKGRKQRRRPEQEKVSPELVKVKGRLDRALGLLDADAADELAGEKSEEYGALLDGVQAANALLWATMQGFGLKKNPGSTRVMAQHQAIVLTLVHYGYALGVRRGRDMMDGGS